MSLQEYETQLAEIEQMLAASPDDPSLLSLKSDLLELIAATLGTSAEDATTTDAPAPAAEATADSQQEPPALEWNTVNDDKNSTTQSSDNPLAQTTTTAAAAPTNASTTITTTTKPKKKKKSANAVFTIPADLKIHSNDSKFQVNRKKRAQAALRKQHESQQASQQATKKQQSWQAFAQRKKTGSSSMFQTDASAKVGVVGQRRLTKFEGPKKHK